jgi:hypothetical protein
MADWNHDAALETLQEAPLRQSSNSAAGAAGSHEPPATTPIETPKISGEITTNDLRVVVTYLASDELEGRLAGSRGGELAADYIAAQMKRIGLLAVGTNEGFFQRYDFNAGARVLTDANRLIVIPGGGAPVEFAVEQDFRPVSFAANAEVEGEVVFVGYGLSVPGKAGEGYDSYAGVSGLQTPR